MAESLGLRGQVASGMQAHWDFTLSQAESGRDPSREGGMLSAAEITMTTTMALDRPPRGLLCRSGES